MYSKLASNAGLQPASLDIKENFLPLLPKARNELVSVVTLSVGQLYQNQFLPFVLASCDRCHIPAFQDRMSGPMPLNYFVR